MVGSNEQAQNNTIGQEAWHLACAGWLRDVAGVRSRCACEGVCGFEIWGDEWAAARARARGGHNAQFQLWKPEAETKLSGRREIGIFFTVLARKEKKENCAAGAQEHQRRAPGGSICIQTTLDNPRLPNVLYRQPQTTLDSLMYSKIRL